VEGLENHLNGFKISPEQGVLDRLKKLGTTPIKNRTSLAQLLKRSEIFYNHICLFDPGLKGIEKEISEEAETRIKYEGYILRQERDVEKIKKMEDTRLPDALNYEDVYGLTREVRDKLCEIRPLSLGQASRISGVTPAALMAVQIHLKKNTP